MAKRIAEASDADYLKLWEGFRDSFRKSTPVDTNETKPQQLARIARLEKDHESWFKYYFPNFYTSEPAPFHIKAANRVIKNDEWFEVRAWSRELAKSARGMMEDIYLAMTGKKKNVLIVSNSHANAERLLAPYKACFESNLRLIHDYGKQEKYGHWNSDEFIIQKGCSFRALGWGESPRGTRNDNYRPDSITIDDIDTDEECRNEDIQTKKMNWIEQALYATRSISNKLLLRVNGNIIHDNCCVKKLGEKADCFEIVNIRNENGKSTWANKNTEEMIDRVLSVISYESAQKEYFNNPMDGTTTFKDLKDGKVPPLKQCLVTIYADPATSNKDVSNASMKGVGIIVNKGFDFYIYKVFLDTMSNSKFIDYLFELYKICKDAGVDPKVWIENNSLQNPFFEQVLLPLIYQRANETKLFLPVSPDTREKKDKYTRIEGTLEPINRLGHLIFNEREADDEHMKRLKAQFKNFSPKQKRMDGPDMVEGGVFKLKEHAAVIASGNVESFKRTNKKRF